MRLIPGAEDRSSRIIAQNVVITFTHGARLAFYLSGTGLNTSVQTADPVVQSRLNIQTDYVSKPLNHGMSSNGGSQQRLVNPLVKLVQRDFILSSHSSNVSFIGHCSTLMSAF